MKLNEIFEILLAEETERIESSDSMQTFFNEVLRKILQSNTEDE